MADFIIKQNDTRPAIAAQLTDNSVAIDLTTAASVKFIMRLVGSTGAPKVNAAGTFLSRSTGLVQYAWVAANTDTVGSYQGEFELTWNDGGVETIPNDSYITIDVIDDLG